MNDIVQRLTAALSDRYTLQRELGAGGMTTDPRFVDTPGWSHSVMPGGDAVYLQATAENLGYYVRVIPNWVTTMKRAVDAANK